MSDEDLTLDELQKKNGSRIQRLAAQKYAVTNLDVNYIIRMLEALLGENLGAVQYKYQVEVAGELDNLEKQVRITQITNNGRQN